MTIFARLPGFSPEHIVRKALSSMIEPGTMPMGKPS